MTARDTYQSSIKSAAATKTATLTANELTKQETINASGVNVGYNLQSGNFANFDTATKSAVQAKRDADFGAEVARQKAADAAREALRATGDVGPL